ncbi:hypothetical protein CcI156_10935 [Frankia sp. CcI156]|uniref:hypothetical protein n=1 Tax=unclassified Frankia TaxID=2632575 RepID=UPI0003D063A8|nr:MULTISPECIES: hypothetical protein [Frankia]ETA02416.1 hypothetical protein CcI6DRAFT_02211 [Frankia sp. CcI6]KDA44862.1 hypothetical protein BMG523Draft_00386 [Frankia sp. BMG5.23]KEZ35816.1 Phosphoadenosine phosphosulfate reductase family [Frankia sp. CeD]KFB04716.1 Phosphoadenosine phosphosulfate reductase family [Frankia sp. Allo2]OAA25074.1 hypothetical protein AAY23_104216 [Frankia casuarinae]
MSEPTIRVLSLGAGIQSTTLALLAVEAALPRPDAAIFADTGWEPRAVYEHLDRSRMPLDQAPIDKLTRAEWIALYQPTIFDTLDEEGDPDGCSPYGCRSGATA